MLNYRGSPAKQAEVKSKWILKKDCAFNSIKEIECFLHNLDKAFRATHLYKFLR